VELCGDTIIENVGYLCGVTLSKLAMSNLATRILVALVGIPIVVAIILAGGWWLAGLCAAIAALGAGELYRMAHAKGIRAIPVVGIPAAGLVPLALHGGCIACLPALLAAACGIALLVHLRRGIEGALSALSVTVLGIVYPGLFVLWLIPLRQWNVSSPLDGAWVVLAMITGIWICDTAAYFAGRSIGRRPLAPTVSPKKTWEGAFAGGITTILWCSVVVPAVLPWGTAWLGAAIGATIGTVGQLGDLAESLLKRDAAIKDSSAIIPGHGGVLDRFDSVIATAPAVYGLLLLLRWFAFVP